MLRNLKREFKNRSVDEKLKTISENIHKKKYSLIIELVDYESVGENTSIANTDFILLQTYLAFCMSKVDAAETCRKILSPIIRLVIANTNFKNERLFQSIKIIFNTLEENFNFEQIVELEKNIIIKSLICECLQLKHQYLRACFLTKRISNYHYSITLEKTQNTSIKEHKSIIFYTLEACFISEKEIDALNTLAKYKNIFSENRFESHYDYLTAIISAILYFQINEREKCISQLRTLQSHGRTKHENIIILRLLFNFFPTVLTVDETIFLSCHELQEEKFKTITELYYEKALHLMIPANKCLDSIIFIQGKLRYENYLLYQNKHDAIDLASGVIKLENKTITLPNQRIKLLRALFENASTGASISLLIDALFDRGHSYQRCAYQRIKNLVNEIKKMGIPIRRHMNHYFLDHDKIKCQIIYSSINIDYARLLFVSRENKYIDRENVALRLACSPSTASIHIRKWFLQKHIKNHKKGKYLLHKMGYNKLPLK